MKKKIHLTAWRLHNLKNEDFFQFYKGLLTRLEKYEFNESHIMTLRETLFSYKRAAEVLNSWDYKHSATALVKKLHLENKEALMGIRDIIYATNRLPKVDNVEQISLLMDWMRGQEGRMSARTQKDQAKAIEKLHFRMKENPDISEALEANDLLISFQGILANTAAMEMLRMGREAYRTDGKETRRGFRGMVTESIDRLLIAMSVLANMDWEEGVYYDLCVNIETYLVTVCGMHQAVATRSKNERSSEDDNQPEDGTDNTVDEEDSTDADNIDNESTESIEGELSQDENN